MSRTPTRRPAPLTVDAIVDAARVMITRDGLTAFSMRRLGTALAVDPMAVYHHVPNKRVLLSLVTARVIGGMELAPTAEPWDRRVRHWAATYWDVVVANRDVIAAGLAEPAIAADGGTWVTPLADAVAASGIDAALVEPNVWLVVDFVHGSALGAGATRGVPADDHDRQLDRCRRAFASGLDTVIAGIEAVAGHRAASGSE